MDFAFGSNHRYGIFECFFSRLLLWRVSGNGDGSTANAGAGDHLLPSWSWMTHSRIDFFPGGEIKIMKRGIKFGSSSDLELIAPIRRLQNCKIKQQESHHTFRNNNSLDVGELWFDGEANTAAEECLIVGKHRYNNCFILLLSGDGHHYQRVGAGHIHGRYLSKDSWEGTIV
jgi:hypothetical protein